MDIGLINEMNQIAAKKDHEYRREIGAKFTEAWQLAKDNIKVAQSKQAQNYNKDKREVFYESGDTVSIFVPSVKKGNVGKLTHKWRGPCNVLKRLFEVNYLVNMPGRNKHKVVHVTNMKHGKVEIPIMKKFLITQKALKTK